MPRRVNWCFRRAVTACRRVSGRITPSLAGATVTVSAPDMEEPVTAVTDDKGSYQVSEGRVSVSAPDLEEPS